MYKTRPTRDDDVDRVGVLGGGVYPAFPHSDVICLGDAFHPDVAEPVFNAPGPFDGAVSSTRLLIQSCESVEFTISSRDRRVPGTLQD